MALISGSSLGSYEILGPLGSGGMGEVYRARDTKLGRQVAIKVLPEAVATDPERVARFEREAKVLASLNHPHIAALFGMEESEGRHFLIMELVEGETLADRLARGALAVEETLRIALQIAEALEAAHESAIVHRDLKPANVKITPDEQVKVLDFGLAKAMETRPAGGAGSKDPAYMNSPGYMTSPTLSVMASQAGLILGTAAYMSPEQAKGLSADSRSDVFSFGVVLYEMLTGRQPFLGDTAPDVMASVLVRDADLAALPPTVNPRLKDLLRRCLEKSPKKRWQAVGDLRAELEAIAARPRGASTIAHVVVERQSPWKLAIAAGLGATVAAMVIGGAMWMLKSTPPPATITRFPVTLGEGQQFSSTGRNTVAISPDGTKIVYVANQRLYLRSMGELQSRPIPGTEILGNVTSPVFSPDGLSIALFSTADDTLKKIGMNGGVAITICPATNPFGMSWGDDGIVFGLAGSGIMRVSPNGGKPEVLVPVKDGETAHGPQVLAGGEVVLFTLAAGTGADRWDKAQIVAQSLRSGERKLLIEGGSDARHVPPGHLVYAVGGSLFAVRFDLRRLEVVGGPTPIVEGVRRMGNPANPGTTHFSISTTGSLIYVSGPTSASSTQRDLALLDRNGGVQVLKLPPGPYEVPRVSHDGKRAAFGRDDGREAAIWIYDLSGSSSPRRLTSEGRNRFPIWSRDDQRVAFQSDREGDPAIFWQHADGSGTAERLTKPDQGTSHVPESWSPTEDRFLFTVTKGSAVSLWTLSLQDKKAEPFGGVQSSNNPTSAVFSPDGRWVAYYSNQTGRHALMAQPFPATGAKHQIATDAEGDPHHPLWSRDGKELFYVPAPGQFVVRRISTTPVFTFGNAAPVQRGPLLFAGPGSPRTFGVTPDGKILGTVDASAAQSGAPATNEIRVVLNWLEELKAKVPVK